MKLDQALIQVSLNMKNCYKRRKYFDDNFKSNKAEAYDVIKTHLKKDVTKHDEWMKAIDEAIEQLNDATVKSLHLDTIHYISKNLGFFQR